jgi:hypothetical protein
LDRCLIVGSKGKGLLLLLHLALDDNGLRRLIDKTRETCCFLFLLNLRRQAYFLLRVASPLIPLQ